jgi:hypothetical protein
MFMVLSMGISSWVTLAASSGGSGTADVVGQPNGAGDNVEELRDRVVLDAHHQNSLKTVRGLPSAVFRVMSELGILNFLMMSKTSTHDCTSFVFSPVCTHCG